MIKRLHDMELSGWLSLLSIIPVANIIFGFILLLVPGSSGPNKYGPPTKPTNNAVGAVAVALLIVMIVGILAAIAIPAYQDYVERAKQSQSD